MDKKLRKELKKFGYKMMSFHVKDNDPEESEFEFTVLYGSKKAQDQILVKEWDNTCEKSAAKLLWTESKDLPEGEQINMYFDDHGNRIQEEEMDKEQLEQAKKVMEAIRLMKYELPNQL